MPERFHKAIVLTEAIGISLLFALSGCQSTDSIHPTPPSSSSTPDVATLSTETMESVPDICEHQPDIRPDGRPNIVLITPDKDGAPEFCALEGMTEKGYFLVENSIQIIVFSYQGKDWPVAVRQDSSVLIEASQGVPDIDMSQGWMMSPTVHLLFQDAFYSLRMIMDTYLTIKQVKYGEIL
jgi:hypothetical protein